MELLFPFPSSFPNKEETLFLKVVLSSDEDFLSLFNQWKNTTEFEKVDFATMRLLSLLYRRIQKAALHNEITGRIQGVYKMNWAKNQLLLRQVENISHSFESAGIRMVLMKGISLILVAYQDVGARFLDDADLFIDPKDVKKMLELLPAIGCTLKTIQVPDMSYFSPESLQRISHGTHFTCNQSVQIDMHWRVFPCLLGDDINKVMPFEKIFENSQIVEFYGKQYRVMCPEDLLLHVIVHGAEGNIHRTLRWVTDAVALLGSKKINWQVFLKNTQDYGFTPQVYMAFSYLLLQDFIKLPKEISLKILSYQPSQQQMHDYYKKANAQGTPFQFLGQTPFLWKIYSRHESFTLFPFNVFGFIKYLSKVWGSGSTKEFAQFFIQKISTKINVALRLFIQNYIFK